MNDSDFMAKALREAEKAFVAGEVPVGCVIAKDGKIIARAGNARETKKNALYHAEILAIHKACRRLCGWRLAGCEIFVTLEPCPMCAGAILNARPAKVHIALPDPKYGAFGGSIDLSDLPGQYKPEIVWERDYAAPSTELLQSFFARLRKEKSRNTE